MNKESQIQPNNSEDRILWQSEDGIVMVRRRVRTAMRWPQHSRPIITLDVLPGEKTRVRRLKNGRIDICLEHEAQVALIKGLNEIETEIQYGLPTHIPKKPLERKLRFDRLNAERWERRRRRWQ
jgi:hypothetical protein